MIVEDTRMKKIVDLKCFILSVNGCVETVLLFEPVEPVEPVEALNWILIEGFYISRVQLAGLLMTSMTWMG